MSKQLINIDTFTKVAFLRQPLSYADHPSRVETIQTHMSWVFLTDHFVYKLKKPILLDFIDFRTLQQRHQNCLEELRLNRRLAADIYLDVIPLTAGNSGQLELGGEGTPVDWLVKMRRLPRERMLDDLIARQAVDAYQIHQAVQVLTNFYQQTEPEKPTTDEYIGQFERDIRTNEKALSEPRFKLPCKRIHDMTKALLHYLLYARPVIDARVRARRIIETHGDLRPEHVCLTDPPVFIDCLEFNRRLRVLDSADELAFLAMECEFSGAPYIGPLLFDSYRRCSGDDPPHSLVCFYQAYRALLRAKLTIWHLRDHENNEAEKWIQRTRRYLRLAAHYTAELPGKPRSARPAGQR